ncbi:hypothetical protein RIVM261_066770 [Rivularia sp. IAM M-261]|nr:hypothetical protein CAL7716_044590 [Calothrix sp. PCC 7716]GJD21721.1 hypothetical protein RIVM261_066770 [Rivularia sp. IAM M-261]
MFDYKFIFYSTYNHNTIINNFSQEIWLKSNNRSIQIERYISKCRGVIECIDVIRYMQI